MRIYELEQGSEEWFQARCSVITASMFKIIRDRVNGLSPQWKLFVEAMKTGITCEEAALKAGYKSDKQGVKLMERQIIMDAIKGLPVGDFTTAAENYAMNIAMERISGEPQEENFSTWQMERGQRMEEEARLAYESKAGAMIETSGFITTDDGKFGASSDGIESATNSGIEIKCLLSGTRIKSVIIENDISEFLDQVHGNIWIGEMDYLDFVLYVPALKKAGRDTTIIRVERDQDYIDALERDLLEFEALVQTYEKALRGEAEEAIAA